MAQLDKSILKIDENQEKGYKLDTEDYLALEEFMLDVRSCSRLTPWEADFLESIETKLNAFNCDTLLSNKQRAIINKIAAEKVYAIG